MKGTAGLEPHVTLESRLSPRVAAGNLGDLIRIPNRRADIPLGTDPPAADVIGRHHFAVGTLDASHVTDVPVYAILAQDDLRPPGFSVILAQARPDAVGIGSESVRQT